MAFRASEKLRSASVPHIGFDVPVQPSPHFAIHTRVMQFGWRNSGKFALVFSLFIIFAVLAPFTLALFKGSVKPLLPLISIESGSESEAGIFSIALYMTALVGAVMSTVRYVYVSCQNEGRNWRLGILNKLGLTFGFFAFAGLIIVASFRVSMQRPEDERLVATIFMPHMIGGFLALFFGALYILFQTCLSLIFYEGNGRVVLVRFILFLMCGVCLAVSAMSQVTPQSSDIYLQAGVIVQPIKDPHVLRSVFEWLLVFFFAIYFLTFVPEGQKISVSITFRHIITGRRISIASLTNMSKI